jgi:guanyl-specific ribonuclease Sa
MIRPFLDHASHLGSAELDSDLLSDLITRGASRSCLDTLHRNKSPSTDCVASISDFCLADDACQAKDKIGDGPLEVERVCKMVNVGWSFAIKMDPLRYLEGG